MNPHDVFCPNPDCLARGRSDAGNIWIHSRTPPRYRCTVCRGLTRRLAHGTRC